MASYDSDSSSDGESKDVQTNVTLGYATTDQSIDEVSHIGGHPTFLDTSSKPPGSFSKCKVCNGYLSLLLQLQADLSKYFPGEERRLHIWTCRKRQCSRKIGSVRAYREVRKAAKRVKTEVPAPVQPTSSPQNLGSQLFGGSAASTSSASKSTNPFSKPTTTNGNFNPFSKNTATNFVIEDAGSVEPLTQTLADKLKISSDAPSQTKESEPWPSEELFTNPFSHFYLDAEGEYLDKDSSSDPTASSSNTTSNARIMDLDDSSTAADKDLYEDQIDKTFQKFSRILAQNPEQVLRYEFKGTPLLYSSTDAVAPHFVMPHHANTNSKVKSAGPVRGVPGCQYCGAARSFEMQLVPNLIYEVEKDDEDAMRLDGTGMEWGTVIVGTCTRNCGEEGGKVSWREEWVSVQYEEQAGQKRG